MERDLEEHLEDKNCIEECWRDIEGYEGLYKVSNLGNVLSLEKIRFFGKNSKNKRIYPQKILKPTRNRTKNGYYIVVLCKEGVVRSFTIHRLVLKAFVKNILNLPSINHINGDKLDNRLHNLEWCTHSYNSKHAFLQNKQEGAFKSENNISNKKCESLITGEIFISLKEAWRKTEYPKCYETFLKNIKHKNFEDTKVKLCN